MQVSDAHGSMRRRWLVATIGLVLTLGGVVFALLRMPAEYASTGQVLLLPPSTEMGVSGKSNAALMSNPYMSLDYSLSSATDVLVSTVNTTQSLEAIERNGARVTIARAVPESGGSIPPVVTVESIAASPTAAEAGARNAVEAVVAELDTMQASTTATRSLWISARVIEAPTSGDGIIGGRLRAAGAILLAGCAVTFLAVLAVDRARRRRSDDDATAQERIDVPAGRV